MILLCHTEAGVFTISQREDYRFDLVFEAEWLGTYDDEQQAIEALCDGEVFQPSAKHIDFSTLTIPRNVLEWDYIRS
ncbi:hypothetical protein ACFQUU_21590 [Herbaspirillum sp. GCM10030257]|uniref:hypothetical protein n=1 Tax=Herbaspirillum sp. GCM10030257 TaxID=3273393 RepID=UPI0036230933